MNEEFDIFISCVDQDRERVKPITTCIRSLGWRVWWVESREASELYATAREEARERAKCIVVLWSIHGIESSLVIDEALQAWRREKLVSIQIDDGLVLPEPFDTEPKHNLSAWSGSPSDPGWQAVFRALMNIAGPPAGIPASVRDPDAEESQATAAPVAPSQDAGTRAPDGDPGMSDTLAGASAATRLPASLSQQLAVREAYRTETRAAPPVPAAAPAPASSPISVSPPGSSAEYPRNKWASPSAPFPLLRVAVKYALLAGALAAVALAGYKLLPAIFGITASPKPRKPDDTTGRLHPVDCSVFAPPKLAVSGALLVQVYLHPPGGSEDAARGARQFDSAAEWRGFTSLSLDLAKDTRVGVQLEVEGLAVSDEGFDEIVWHRGVAGTSFKVSAAENADPGKYFGKVRLLVDGLPAGKINFIIEVQASLTAEVPPEGVGDSAHRYSKAFISYASEDRVEVLKRVQTLSALKISYFQDVLDLEPGDRWEQELYKQIDHCDLFLLFWSSAARDSKWVYEEALYALKRHSKSENDQPDIIPVLIEGPPPPRPWSDFSHLHFNDKLIYLMRPASD